MIEHTLEHARETAQRHSLVPIGEISIVAVGAHGHPRCDRCVKLRWIESPLLARIVSKEFLVQVATYTTDDDVFRRHDWIAQLDLRFEETLELEGREVRPIQPVDGIQIDRHWH